MSLTGTATAALAGVTLIATGKATVYGTGSVSIPTLTLGDTTRRLIQVVAALIDSPWHARVAGGRWAASLDPNPRWKASVTTGRWLARLTNRNNR